MTEIGNKKNIPWTAGNDTKNGNNNWIEEKRKLVETDKGGEKKDPLHLY